VAWQSNQDDAYVAGVRASDRLRFTHHPTTWSFLLTQVSQTPTHLLQVHVNDDLLDGDAGSARSDVADDSGAVVVVIMGRATLHGCLGLDFDHVANLVVGSAVDT